MTGNNDPYLAIAERHGFGQSQPYLRVLRFLMTPVQAEIAVLLPGSPPQAFGCAPPSPQSLC